MRDMLIACPLCKGGEGEGSSLPSTPRNQFNVRPVMGTISASQGFSSCSLCNGMRYIDDEVYNKLRENLVDDKRDRDNFLIKNPKREIDLD